MHCYIKPRKIKCRLILYQEESLCYSVSLEHIKSNVSFKIPWYLGLIAIDDNTQFKNNNNKKKKTKNMFFFVQIEMNTWTGSYLF